MRLWDAVGIPALQALPPWHMVGKDWPQGLGCPPSTCCPPQNLTGLGTFGGLRSLLSQHCQCYLCALWC